METQTTQITTPPTQAEPKKTAGNIAKAISEKVQGKASVATPPITGDQKPPADPVSENQNAGKRKYVVDGQEVWLTEAEKDTWVQKAMGYEKKLSKMSHLQNEYSQFLNDLIKNPGKVLSNVAKQANVPLKQIVQNVLNGNNSDEVKDAVGSWYYDNAVAPLKRTPEEQKAWEDAKYRQDREQFDKVQGEEQIRRENAMRVNMALSQITGFISEAMKDSGLPSNDTPLGAEMARMVADTIRVAQREGRSLTPKQAIEFVKKRIMAVNNAYYETLDGEELVNTLGEKVSDKVKKHFLKIAQESQNKPPSLAKIRSGSNNGERNGTKSMDDFHDYLEKRKREG